MDQADAEATLSKGYRRGKGIIIDASLCDLYVHLVRRSERFIWIENQFFTGGLLPCPCAPLAW